MEKISREVFCFSKKRSRGDTGLSGTRERTISRRPPSPAPSARPFKKLSRIELILKIWFAVGKILGFPSQHQNIYLACIPEMGSRRSLQKLEARSKVLTLCSRINCVICSCWAEGNEIVKFVLQRLDVELVVVTDNNE